MNTAEPELVYWLQNTWRHQGKAITYKELREAIMNGYLDPEDIEAWQQDYSNFVIHYLQPAYESAFEAATIQLAQKYPMFAFDPMTEGVQHWMKTAGAKFVTNSTQEQIAAIRHVVSRAALLNEMSVDGLARAIRAMVGLNKPQAAANLNYYTKLIQNGVSQKNALEKSIRYSARQSRYRGFMIARTELAFAYNKGEHFGVQQAMEQGYMGTTRKIWCTADDERTCDVCGELEGKTIEFDECFGFKTKLKATEPTIDQTPPAHPNCRCAVIYEEVEPPTFRTP